MISTALILAAFGLLVTEHAFHYPVALMALWGMILIVRDPRRAVAANGPRTLLAVFACIWLPMVAALPDAAAPGHSLKTVLLYLHFFPAGYFLLEAAADPRVARGVLFGVAGWCAWLCGDALIQAVFGHDLLGYPDDSPVLKGAFYPKQRLGLILAVLAPVYLEGVRVLAARTRWAWTGVLALLIVILWSLKRTAWIMLATALAAYVWLAVRQGARLRLRAAILPATAIAAVVALAFVFNPALGSRAGQTFGLLRPDLAAIDQATSYRFSLWRTGATIFAEHWVNGVGPRGYRYAYRSHAPADDFWLRRGADGQTHPHLLLLEIAVESGVIGLAGYAALGVVLLRRLARGTNDRLAAPWLLAVIVAWFPLNAHLAFYGSYWSTLVWLMLPLGLARAAPVARSEAVKISMAVARTPIGERD